MTASQHTTLYVILYLLMVLTMCLIIFLIEEELTRNKEIHIPAKIVSDAPQALKKFDFF